MIHKIRRCVSVGLDESAHDADNFYDVRCLSTEVSLCVFECHLLYNGVRNIQVVVVFILDDGSYGAFTKHVHLNLVL